MSSSRQLGAVSSARKRQLLIDGDGHCSLDSIRITHQVESGEIQGYNAHVTKIMEGFRAKSVYSLTLNQDYVARKIKELKELGLFVYNLLGDHFYDQWSKHDGNELLDVAVTSRNFPLLWEWLYTGPFDGGVEIGNFWGARHQITRKFTGVDSFCGEHSPPEQLLFTQNRILAHVQQEIVSLREICQSQNVAFTLLDERINAAGAGEGDDSGWDKLVISAWTDEDYSFIHLATHMYPDQDPDAPEKITRSFLDLSIGSDRVRVPLHILGAALREFRFRTQPLVFLNACKTLDTEHLLHGASFPKTFMLLGATGVIATTCNVSDLFAKEFAKKFYALLFGLDDGRPVSPSQALLDARHYFLEKYNNPLGFAYVLFSREDLPAYWEGV